MWLVRQRHPSPLTLKLAEELLPVPCARKRDADHCVGDAYHDGDDRHFSLRPSLQLSSEVA
jgi:hypothetical protein